jgi:hypothetical protein
MFCDLVPLGIDYYSLLIILFASAIEITLWHSNLHAPSGHNSNRVRNQCLNRNAIYFLPYAPPCLLLFDVVDQVFGIIILLLIFIQGGFGYYHHHRFVKDRPSSRRWFTHTHLWLGRFIILSGLLNCGCGLLLVFIDWKYVILWWIICGLFAIAYAIASIMTLRYRAKKAGEPFGSATGNVFNPERYKRAEAYEMDTSNRSIRGMI